MKDEISEVKELVKELGSKFDDVMECKAEKSEVEAMSKQIKNLSDWQNRIIAVGSLLLFLLTFLLAVL
jgi:DNA-binding transcriptional regulator GbsR (MarR family)